MNRQNKRLIQLSCIIFGLMLIAYKAEGENWILVKTIGETQMFVDKDSIRSVAKNVVSAWRKYQFKKPQKIMSKDVISLWVNTEEDCAEVKFRVLEELFYFPDNTSEPTSYPESEWESIKPESFNYFLNDFVCRDK